MARHGGEMS